MPDLRLPSQSQDTAVLRACWCVTPLIFTLTALSAERYMVIVHPMTAVHRSTDSPCPPAPYLKNAVHRSTAGVSSSLLRTVLVAAGIWVVSAGLASMELVAARVSTDGPVAACHAYPDEWGDAYVSFHVIFRFLVYFALPILTTRLTMGQFDPAQTDQVTLTQPIRTAHPHDCILLCSDGSHVDCQHQTLSLIHI